MPAGAVVFALSSKPSDETVDKIEILAKEEGAFDIGISTNPKGEHKGTSFFSDADKAESFAKKVQQFAGVTIIRVIRGF